MNDKTIRELQSLVHWPDENYSEAWRESRMPHKRFDHAVKHISKACNHLMDLSEAMDHKSFQWDPSLLPKLREWAADAVICTLRACNEFPFGKIELTEFVEDRIHGKQRTTPPPPEESLQRQAERIVAVVVHDLRDRSGIGDAIDGCDEEIQDQIHETLVGKVLAVLQGKTP